MLRKITALMAVLMLLVTGCATKVNDPQSVTEGYKMAKVNGVLYYDIAKDGKTEASSDVVVGELSKAGEVDEIPVDDNTCNFDGATGWQLGEDEGEIEICVDGKWMLFRSIEVSTEEIEGFKYCKYMQGTLPDAEIVDKMLVLTNDRDATYNEVMTYYMNAEQGEESEYYPIYLMEE